MVTPSDRAVHLREDDTLLNNGIRGESPPISSGGVVCEHALKVTVGGLLPNGPELFSWMGCLKMRLPYQTRQFGIGTLSGQRQLEGGAAVTAEGPQSRRSVRPARPISMGNSHG